MLLFLSSTKICQTISRRSATPTAPQWCLRTSERLCLAAKCRALKPCLSWRTTESTPPNYQRSLSLSLSLSVWVLSTLKKRTHNSWVTKLKPSATKVTKLGIVHMQLFSIGQLFHSWRTTTNTLFLGNEWLISIGDLDLPSRWPSSRFGKLHQELVQGFEKLR